MSLKIYSDMSLNRLPQHVTEKAMLMSDGSLKRLC
jgi:hypothetical protein